MSPETKFPTALSRRGRIVLWSSIVVIMALAATMVWVRQAPTPVSVNDAVADFREGGPTFTLREPHAIESAGPTTTAGTVDAGPPTSEARDAPAAPTGAAPPPRAHGQPDAPAGANPPVQGALTSLPEQGVYEFRTTGGGETDALGGARHDYPEIVPFTVHHTECGFTARWQPLKERWDEWEFCAPPGSRQMLRISTYHEFFKRGFGQDFDCGQTDAFASTTPGHRWTWSCRSSSSTIEATAAVVGLETLDIGGQPVEALHINHEAVFHGSNEGSQTFDWWLHHGTGMPLKMVRSVRTNSESPFGRVNYTEQATSTAVSMSPRR